MNISVSVFACPRHDVAGYAYLLDSKYADSIHIDLMDGICVPLKGVGYDDLEYVSANTNLPVDIHLMVNDQRSVYRKVSRMRHLRNVILTIEHSCRSQLLTLVDEIRHDGYSPFVAIWPKTPIHRLHDYLEAVDGILVMTTEAGIPNSEYLDNSVMRVSEIMSLRPVGEKVVIIDGGMNTSRISKMSELGVDECVVGKSFFDDCERFRLEMEYRSWSMY